MSQVYGAIPFATLGRNYGVPWGTYGGLVYQSNTLTTTNDMQLSGIHWDETDARLYWTSCHLLQQRLVAYLRQHRLRDADRHDQPVDTQSACGTPTNRRPLGASAGAGPPG
jgi:hypothetical protein